MQLQRGGGYLFEPDEAERRVRLRQLLGGTVLPGLRNSMVPMDDQLLEGGVDAWRRVAEGGVSSPPGDPLATLQAALADLQPQGLREDPWFPRPAVGGPGSEFIPRRGERSFDPMFGATPSLPDALVIPDPWGGVTAESAVPARLAEIRRAAQGLPAIDALSPAPSSLASQGWTGNAARIEQSLSSPQAPPLRQGSGGVSLDPLSAGLTAADVAGTAFSVMGGRQVPAGYAAPMSGVDVDLGGAPMPPRRPTPAAADTALLRQLLQRGGGEVPPLRFGVGASLGGGSFVDPAIPAASPGEWLRLEALGTGAGGPEDVGGGGPGGGGPGGGGPENVSGGGAGTSTAQGNATVRRQRERRGRLSGAVETMLNSADLGIGGLANKGLRRAGALARLRGMPTLGRSLANLGGAAKVLAPVAAYGTAVLPAVMGAVDGYNQAGAGGAVIQGASGGTGALIGGAIGTAIAPGVGTVIGAGIGSMLGSGVGGALTRGAQGLVEASQAGAGGPLDGIGRALDPLIDTPFEVEQRQVMQQMNSPAMQAIKRQEAARAAKARADQAEAMVLQYYLSR